MLPISESLNELFEKLNSPLQKCFKCYKNRTGIFRSKKYESPETRKSLRAFASRRQLNEHIRSIVHGEISSL